jgi:hypothetical protein
MKKHFSFTIISLMVLFSAVSCVTINIDKTSIKDGMHEDYQPPSSAQLYGTYNYSMDQSAMMQELGVPTRFTILLGENNRFETWHYDTRGYTAVFMNGAKTSEKHTIPEYRDGMYATTYTPELFYAGMDINDVVLATGKHDFQLSTIESDSIEERLMHLEGLAAGFQDGAINYVETYPALSERKLNAAEFTDAAQLTPEESANNGAHEYLVVIYVDNEPFDSYNSEIEIQFAQDKVCLTENNETYCFMRVSENHYESVEYQTQMAFILDGFIWIQDDEGMETEVLFSRVDD